MIWRQIDTEQDFRACCAGHSFAIAADQFTIHTDGRVAGLFQGLPLTGRWWWQNGLFCRTATLGAEDLGLDQETIAVAENAMRYCGEGGKGAPRIAHRMP